MYELTAKYDSLSDASTDLAQVITHQTKRLVETSSTSDRQWNWGAFVVSWIVAGAFGSGIYLLSSHWGSWWGTLLLVLFGILGALFTVVGIGVLIERKNESS